MSGEILLLLILTILGTSLLSGVFGMLGGIILMGVLLVWLPVPVAMILHGVTQLTANGWRAWLWRRHVMTRVIPGYLLGSAIVFAVLSLMSFSPPKPWVLLALGAVPFAARLVPRHKAPDIRRRGAPSLVGAGIMALHVFAGVAGPLLDVFFLDKELDRRLVVATKAATQALGHILKIAYFGLLGAALPADTMGAVPIWIYPLAIASAIVGTTLSKPILARFPNDGFQAWSRRLVLVIGAIYLWRGIDALN